MKQVKLIIYNFERCGVLALLQLCKVAGICSTAIKGVNIKNIDNNELKCFTKDALGAIFTIRVTFTILVQYFFLQTKLIYISKYLKISYNTEAGYFDFDNNNLIDKNTIEGLAIESYIDKYNLTVEYIDEGG